MRKMLALVLCILMVLSIAPAALAEYTIRLETEGKVNVGEDELLIWVGDDRWAGFQNGNLDILKMVAEDVQMNLVFANKTADAAGFMRTKLAAGEIPDVIDGYGNLADYTNMVNDGILAEIPVDMIRENMPNYTKWIEWAGGKDVWKIFERNGKNWALPNNWTLATNGMGLGIREDLFEKAGVEKVPTTIDEFADAAEKLYQSQGIPAIGGFKDLYKETLAFVTAAYDGYPFTFYEKDGKLVFGSIEPEMEKGLEVLADWYKKGYIDPEYATLDFEAIKAKWESDMIGSTVYYWWAFYPPGTLYGTDFYNLITEGGRADAKVTHIDFPAGPTGTRGTLQSASTYLGPVFGKHMTQELIAKYLKMYDKYSMTDAVNLLMAGTEGVHYTWDDEEGVVRTPEFTRVNAEGETVEDADKLHEAGVRVIDCIPITLNNYEVQAYTNFKPKFQPLRDAGNAKGVGKFDVAKGLERPLWNEKSETLQNMATDFFNDVVTGKRPASDLSAFREEWLAAGGQEVIDEANAAFYK